MTGVSFFGEKICPTPKTTTNGWLCVGSIVGLCIEGKMVGKGCIASLDPNKMVHNVAMGKEKAYVIIKEALSPHVIYKDDETLKENVGSFAAWEINQLQPTSNCPSILKNMDVPSLNETEKHDFQKHNDNFKLDHHHQRDFNPTLSLKRFVWRGTTVKLIDEKGLHFANGNIHEVEIGMKIGETTICQKNVGVHIQDLVSGASTGHLKFRDTIKVWPLYLIVASDGMTLKYHQDQILAEVDDQASKSDSTLLARKYIFKSRKRRIPPQGLTRKKKAISDEAIQKVSSLDCCMRRCCQLFPRNELKEVRVQFWGKSFEEKNKEKTNIFQNHLQLIDGQEIVVIKGFPICLEAWRIIHGLGKTQFLGQKRLVKAGWTETTHGNVGKRHMTSKVHQGLMTMKAVIEENADLHPAKSRTMTDRSREVVKELPTTFSWERIRNSINTVNAELGLESISQSSLSVLRNKFFKEVTIHKKGNNFSRCNQCSEFDQRRAQISCKEEKDQLRMEIDEHHLAHTHGQRLYHAWRDESIRRPDEVLCIIHDKMDHFKTALPRFPFTPKSLADLYRLPVTVTGILTHGHGPKAFAQYHIGLWSGDSNLTIGSLDAILRTLEDPQPAVQNLIKGPDSTNLFESLLMGRENILKEKVYKAFDLGMDTDSEMSMEENDQCSTSTLRPFKKLPRVLKLQLDNCTADNKNRWFFAYLSLLTARDVFEEVHLGFLMVGHTHEDVDAMFAHFSESLKHRPAYSLPELMSMFMSSRKPTPVPHFVQEVPDFKSFVAPYMLEGVQKLYGHKQPRLFRFYKRSDQMPCMQWKLRSMDEYWLPEDGIPLWGWSTKEPHMPRLPSGSPKRLPMNELKDLKDIRDGLKKHAEFFEKVAKRQHSISANFLALKTYWERIMRDLEETVIRYRPKYGNDLQHGFWPQSQWKDHVPAGYQNVALQLEEKSHYVGPIGRKPKQSFDPLLHITLGMMILVRLASKDISTFPVWLGEVRSEIKLSNTLKNAKGQFEHTCLVQWYRPEMYRNSKRNTPTKEQRWEQCWEKKWEWDKTRAQEEFPISTVLWGYNHKNKARSFKISKINKQKALDNLERCIAEEVDSDSSADSDSN